MKKLISYLILFILFSVSSAIAETSLPVEQMNKKAAIQKLSANMENVAKHLELLGYKIDKNNYVTNDGKPFFLAWSDVDNNLIIVENTPGFINFATILNTKKPLYADMMDFANKANSLFEIARMYCSLNKETKNADINFLATYIGEYSKNTFGSFITILKNDINLIRAMNDYEKVFLNK